VFYLPDKGVTVAQLLPKMKNTLSHRAQAFIQLKKAFENESHWLNGA
jgi:inosine/xanthosine triphosphate pyrophosphatase family protein